ncbi:hypothetical protein L1887_29116 [Cichorium endivia]|nr:hypothetical protein L1887_29116 [Cichorium endivia]
MGSRYVSSSNYKAVRRKIHILFWGYFKAVWMSFLRFLFMIFERIIFILVKWVFSGGIHTLKVQSIC